LRDSLVLALRCQWPVRRVDQAGQASRLLITADGGGSNSYWVRLWKPELAALAEQTGLVMTVCHLPTSSQSTSSTP
jgi:hypothetical protein